MFVEDKITNTCKYSYYSCLTKQHYDNNNNNNDIFFTIDFKHN